MKHMRIMALIFVAMLAMQPAVALADEVAPQPGIILEEEDGIVVLSDDELTGDEVEADEQGEDGASMLFADDDADDVIVEQADSTFNVTVDRVVYYDEAYKFLALFNQKRSANGMASLQWSYALEKYALQRATESAVYWNAKANTRPDGSAATGLEVFEADRAMSDYLGEHRRTCKTSATTEPVQYYYNADYKDYVMPSTVTHIGAACVKVGSRYYMAITIGKGSGANTSRCGRGTSSTQKANTAVAASNVSATVSPSTVSLQVSKTPTATLSLTVKGGCNSETVLTPASVGWQSSNSSVAAVSSTGIVTAKAAGTATVSCKSGSVALGSAKVTVASAPASNKIDISKAQLRFREADLVYPFNGTQWRPFGITYGGAGFFFSAKGYTYPTSDSVFEAWGGELEEGKDYAVSYSRNTNIGTAKAVFTGIGSYTGTRTITFSIVDNPFVDVTQSTGHCNDILWLANKKITQGWDVACGKKEFRPYAHIARADMAAFLFRLAVNWKLVSDSWQPSGKVTFKDVSIGTSHYREIMWLAESGISQGWTVGGKKEFRPYAHIARADMAAFLFRLATKAGIVNKDWEVGDTNGDWEFCDCDEDTSHYTEISWLGERGISTGFDTKAIDSDGWEYDGRAYRPYANVARADMAAFLWRLDVLKT